MYKGTMASESSSVARIDATFKRKDKQRQRWFDALLLVRRGSRSAIPPPGLVVGLFPENQREDLAKAACQKTIMELAEMMPQTDSFSATLLADESFCEMCKISCRGSAQGWFEQVIKLSPEEEQGFDSICREIIAKLVRCHGAMMKKRTDKKKPISLYRNVLELLQGHSIDLIMKGGLGASAGLPLDCGYTLRYPSRTRSRTRRSTGPVQYEE
jgi:hypothetical protein